MLVRVEEIVEAGRVTQDYEATSAHTSVRKKTQEGCGDLLQTT